MANKTVDQILYDFSRYVRHHERTGLGGEGINSIEASRQLYEAELERIGEDEEDDDSMPYGEVKRIRWQNKLRAELRAKARAFYGITESEGSAE